MGAHRFVGWRQASAKASNGRRSQASTSGPFRSMVTHSARSSRAHPEGRSPNAPVSSAMIAKVGAAARHNRSAAPRAAALPPPAEPPRSFTLGSNLGGGSTAGLRYPLRAGRAGRNSNVIRRFHVEVCIGRVHRTPPYDNGEPFKARGAAMRYTTGYSSLRSIQAWGYGSSSSSRPRGTRSRS
jgi:hypothetical protein